MGYKHNNPLPRMKSALSRMKAEKKMGLHRDSALHNAEQYGIQGNDELDYMPIMDHGAATPMHRESAELDYMPIVDIEKGDAKGDMKKGSPAKAAKPDYLDLDKDGDKSEPMKEAAKGSPAKKYDRVVEGGNKGDKSKTKPGRKDFEKKGSPAKKYDKVVLGGNKGDKSKTKPGKKDYEK